VRFINFPHPQSLLGREEAMQYYQTQLVAMGFGHKLIEQTRRYWVFDQSRHLVITFATLENAKQLMGAATKVLSDLGAYPPIRAVYHHYKGDTITSPKLATVLHNQHATSTPNTPRSTTPTSTQPTSNNPTVTQPTPRATDPNRSYTRWDQADRRQPSTHIQRNVTTAKPKPPAKPTDGPEAPQQPSSAASNTTHINPPTGRDKDASRHNTATTDTQAIVNMEIDDTTAYAPHTNQPHAREQDAARASQEPENEERERLSDEDEEDEDDEDEDDEGAYNSDGSDKSLGCFIDSLVTRRPQPKTSRGGRGGGGVRGSEAADGEEHQDEEKEEEEHEEEHDPGHAPRRKQQRSKAEDPAAATSRTNLSNGQEKAAARLRTASTEAQMEERMEDEDKNAEEHPGEQQTKRVVMEKDSQEDEEEATAEAEGDEATREEGDDEGPDKEQTKRVVKKKLGREGGEDDHSAQEAAKQGVTGHVNQEQQQEDVGENDEDNDEEDEIALADGDGDEAQEALADELAQNGNEAQGASTEERAPETSDEAEGTLATGLEVTSMEVDNTLKRKRSQPSSRAPLPPNHQGLLTQGEASADPQMYQGPSHTAPTTPPRATSGSSASPPLAHRSRRARGGRDRHAADIATPAPVTSDPDTDSTTPSLQVSPTTSQTGGAFSSSDGARECAVHPLSDSEHEQGSDQAECETALAAMDAAEDRSYQEAAAAYYQVASSLEEAMLEQDLEVERQIEAEADREERNAEGLAQVNAEIACEFDEEAAEAHEAAILANATLEENIEVARDIEEEAAADAEWEANQRDAYDSNSDSQTLDRPYVHLIPSGPDSTSAATDPGSAWPAWRDERASPSAQAEDD
jgi:hypothetical protein